MSDSESLSSDNSDNENFLNDFIENIPDVKAVFTHIKLWAHKQGFFIRKGRNEENRQLNVIVKMFMITNQGNHQNLIKQ
ncbi:4211_t:CDS:2, partial [Funneliformis mosseae]